MQYWLVYYPLECGLMIILVTIAAATLLCTVAIYIIFYLWSLGTDVIESVRSRSKIKPPL